MTQINVDFFKIHDIFFFIFRWIFGGNVKTIKVNRNRFEVCLTKGFIATAALLIQIEDGSDFNAICISIDIRKLERILNIRNSIEKQHSL